MDRDTMDDFALGIDGFRFADLYQPRRLRDLHAVFWQDAEDADPGLRAAFDAFDAAAPAEQSELLIRVAAVLGRFVGRMFAIDEAVAALAAETEALSPVYRLKKDFLRPRVFPRCDKPVTAVDDAAFAALDAEVGRLLAKTVPHGDPEVRFATAVLTLLDGERAQAAAAPADDPRVSAAVVMSAHRGESTPLERMRGSLAAVADWCVQVVAVPGRHRHVHGWAAFVRAGKVDFASLVPVERPDPALPEAMVGPAEHRRLRDGFRLTDPRMQPKDFLREVDYCVICHPRQKDSCSRGFVAEGGGYERNPLGNALAGCPLDERISEMHVLRKRGDAIGALAMIMLDNPMCPGTGHRICNDCMKGCIYQKQDPVNIPQTETGILTDVLKLPYGFEIYSLFTRFNPLNRARPYALPYHGRDVMVVGLGPAGYTLSHYLANDGFGVVGIDGLKLEPVTDDLTGRGRPFPAPIRDFDTLRAALDERILMGFGGVSEYGITVRWDKTFLAVIYLTLLRRQNVRFYGGVRFGGTLDIDDAWRLGFDHVAIAAGAGRPTVIPMKNNLIRGIRKASDFLMALQLTGAFKRSSLANLQVRLPAVVVGGGLTAVDTATELLAYYPVQVEKALAQFEASCRALGEEAVWKMCDPEETEILREFVAHGRAVRDERAAAAREGRAPDLVGLCRSWGGVTLAYRKPMTDSPAYRNNHEEIIKALEEGIAFAENLSPVEAVRDDYGAVAALRCKRADGSEVTLPARAVCVAAGTSPNTTYEREHPGTFALDDRGLYFRPHKLVAGADGGWQLVPAARGEAGAFFLSYSHAGRFVTYYGDNHPDYAGNVVKAMASSKHGAPHVARLFAADIAAAEDRPVDLAAFRRLTDALDEGLVPRVVEVKRLTPTIVEVVVRGRYAADRFQPGQFYRLQNYESLAPVVDGVRLTLEGIALTGAWVDKDRDLLALIVLEMGVSSRLCAALRPGEPVVVMGPTGTPSETPGGETVLLAGGGLGNAVLFSIGKALRERGSRVLYFAGYRRQVDLFEQSALEEATDQVVWAVDAGDPIAPRRPQDRSFVGNIVQAMLAYARGELGGAPLVPLDAVDRIIAIGSDRMMAAVSEARHGVLQPYLKPDHQAIASINSSMQCMMKEVCGQCLQKHVDPATGAEAAPVFSCFNQDQAMDCVDFANLRERLKMNTVAEKLSNRYLDQLLEAGGIARV
ncbi:pyridine nucleotide-disulfide oxidoreductase [bacterium]|nr:MAG: pyridine nucleotide-disulfide oxidoreductase [bacterium]